MTNCAEQVITRLEPVLAPRAFPCQRSSAGTDSVLFHCDGAANQDVATRYPAWFADVARSCDDHVICLDLWVQQEAGKWLVHFENVTDEDLADAAGHEAVRGCTRLQLTRSTPGSIRWRSSSAPSFASTEARA